MLYLLMINQLKWIVTGWVKSISSTAIINRLTKCFSTLIKGAFLIKLIKGAFLIKLNTEITSMKLLQNKIFAPLMEKNWMLSLLLNILWNVDFHKIVKGKWKRLRKIRLTSRRSMRSQQFLSKHHQKIFKSILIRNVFDKRNQSTRRRRSGNSTSKIVGYYLKEP